MSPWEAAEIAFGLVLVFAWWHHAFRRHRRLRRRAGTRRFDPDATHPYIDTEAGRCVCGRAVEHDVHHRIGGIG